MSETKTTPGPWIVTDRSQYNESPSDPKWAVEQESGDEKFWVALVINEANARLISQAPALAAEIEKLRAENGELREALEESIHRLDWSEGLMRVLRATPDLQANLPGFEAVLAAVISAANKGREALRGPA